ncbi:MAG: hypothetical protein RLT87_10265 [Gammaproteobacteria bacterium]
MKKSLISTLETGHLTTAQVNDIQIALKAAQRRFSAITEVEDRNGRSVLCMAVRFLISKGSFEAAITIADARPKNPSLAEMRFLALRRLGDQHATDRAIDELARTPGKSQRLEHVLFSEKLKNPHKLTADDHRRFGPIPRDFEEALRNLGDAESVDADQMQVCEGLIAHIGLVGKEAEAYRERFKWGIRSREYISYVHRVQRSIESRVSKNGDLTPKDRRLLRLGRQMRERVIAPDIAQTLQEPISQGRSIVLLQAHAGVNSFWQSLTSQTGLPEVFFAANARDASSSNRIRTSGGAEMAFAKLAKSIKKAAHLVRLYPDGLAGGDRVHAMVAGVDVTLGPGASVLAWYGNAATYFCETRWTTDLYLQHRLIPGPIADKNRDREQFEFELHGFYTQQLEKIAMESPESIYKGGVWNAFA